MERLYVYDLIQIAEFLVWILRREGMECREERFAYLVLLYLSFSTLMFSQTVLFCGIRKSLNCQSNCKEAFGENSAGDYKHSQNIYYIIGLAGYLQYHITGTERILIGKSTI